MSIYSLQIATNVFDRLKLIPGFKKVWRTPKNQIAPEDLPMLGVFIIREQRIPEGQANQGPISFVCDLSIAVSGTTKMTDDLDQLTELEGMMSAFDNALLTDPSFVQLIEGVVSTDRKLFFTKEGETSLAEIQCEYVFRYRDYYEPVVGDFLEKVHIEARYPTADTTDSEVLQVNATWDIPTS